MSASSDFGLLATHCPETNPALLFDDRAMVPGNHLRWVLSSELGLPNRFVLYRTNNERLQNDINDILSKNKGKSYLEVTLPAICSYIRENAKPFAELNYEKWDPTEWLVSGIPAETKLETLLNDSAVQLKGTIHGLLKYFQNQEFGKSTFYKIATDSPPNTREEILSVVPSVVSQQNSKSNRTQISRIAALQLAALDPYIARMAGFYFIDRNPVFSAHGYFVEADFGSRKWPVQSVETTRPRGYHLQSNSETLGRVSVIAVLGRLTYEWSEKVGHSLLSVKGNVAPILRFRFSEMVQEFYIVLEGAGVENCILYLDGQNTDFTQDINISESGDYAINIRGTSVFERVEIHFPQSGTWKLAQLQWRRKTGEMGRIRSVCAVVQKTSMSNLPAPPILTDCSTFPSPLIVRDSGVVITGLSDVRLSFLAPVHENVMMEAESPVRMLYGKVENGVVSPINKGDLSVIPKMKPALPELLLWLPLNGQLTNAVNGYSAKPYGNFRFIRAGKDSAGARAAFFDGSSALALPNETKLKKPGNSFSVFLRVKPVNPVLDNTYMALFEIGGKANGFSMGLWYTQSQLLLQVFIKGTEYHTDLSVHFGIWNKVGISYDGSQLKLYIGGIPKVIGASHGLFQYHPGSIGIGAEFSIDRPGGGYYKGLIRDVQFWSRVTEPVTAEFLIKEQEGRLPQNFGNTTIFRVSEEQKFKGIFSFDLPTVSYLPDEFSLHAQIIFKANDGANIRNGPRTNLWLGYEIARKELVFGFNGRNFICNGSVPFGRWVEVAVLFQQGVVRFYMDGVFYTSREQLLSYDLLSYKPEPGVISYVKIFPFAIDPTSPENRIGQFNFVDRGVSDGLQIYRAKNIDLFGRISKWGSGVSVKTRADYVTSAPLSLQGEVLQIKAGIAGNPRFIQPAEGEAYGKWLLHFEALHHDEERRLLEQFLSMNPFPDLVRHEVVVYQEKRTQFWDKTEPRSRTLRQNFEIIGFDRSERSILLKDVPFSLLTLKTGDVFTIQYDLAARLQWQWSGLQQVFDPLVDAFSIFRLPVTLNEVLREVDAVEEVAPNSWNVTLIPITVPALSHIPDVCTIDKQAYIIEEHLGGIKSKLRVRYDGYPVIAPKKGGQFLLNLREDHTLWRDHSRPEVWGIQVTEKRTGIFPPISGTDTHVSFTKTTDGEVAHLYRQGVDWLQNDNTLWTLRLTRFQKPDDLADLAPQDYVPGALVVNRLDTMEWDAWYVHWHQWEDFDVLICWVSIKGEQNDQAVIAPSLRITASQPIRFYVGQRFSESLIFPPGAVSTPTHTWHFAVAARALSVPHTYAMSRRLSLVRVDKKLPPPVLGPVINSISKADVHGNSIATVSWDPVREKITGFNLYRAVDSAIVSRDLDQRRLQSGYYATMHPFIEDGLSEADGDVYEFLRAVRHKDADKFAPRFFPAFGKRLSEMELDDLFGHEKNSAKWQAVNPVWQYWADRFYPALSTGQLHDIAERKGNETAFTLVNDTPIPNQPEESNESVSFSDNVNGVVSNLYFYRLRVVGSNLALAPEWGRVSAGGGAEVPAAVPAAPVWTKVEAGDREVRLEWALNREKGLKGYILFRTESEDLLEDLRWARVEKPPRLLEREIQDPVLKVSGDEDGRVLAFSMELLPNIFTRIVGIYRTDEYDTSKFPLNEQPHAFNFARPGVQFLAVDAVSGKISGFRKIALDEPIILLMSDGNGNIRRIEQSVSNYPFYDRDLRGKHTYCYRLAAMNENGALSPHSILQTAKTLEISPPLPPIVGRENRRGSDEYFDCLEMEIQCGNYLQIMVQMRPKGRLAWETILPWTIPPTQPYFFQTEADKNGIVELKAWTRTEHGLPCTAPVEIVFPTIR